MISRSRGARSSEGGNRSRAALASLLALWILAIGVFSVMPGSGAVHVFGPSWDVAAQKNIDVAVSYETLHVESGVPLELTVTVTSAGIPLQGAVINISTSCEDSCVIEFESMTTDQDGRATATVTGYSESGMIMDIYVTASMDGYMSGHYVIEDVTVEPPVYIIDTDKLPSYIGITGIIALIMLGGTEAGRYGLLKVFVVPLYSRLKRDDLLEHFVRGQIYGYIMSHPGEHYSHIKQKLGVTNGTLSHHLRTLELQGYIKSHRDGTYKRFYPTGMKVPRKKGIQLSDLQLGIVDAIRQSPGLSQKEIARQEGISQQSVSYNLSILERMGVINCAREGARKRYYISSES